MKPQFEDTYIVLKGWMRSKLGLKGNKLTAFALVYGFCQDGNNSFDASLAFIRKWLGVSQPTAVNVMAELTGLKYLIKQDNGAGNPFTYTVNWTLVNRLKNFTGKESEPVKKLNTPQLKNFTGGSKKTLLNIYTNKDTNKDSEDARAKNEEPNNLFDINAADKAAQALITFLQENSMFLGEMKNGDWKRAVKGHCNKLQKKGEFYELQVPANENDMQRWLSKRLAGVKSWYNVAKQYDKPKNSNATETEYKAPTNVRRPKKHNA